MSNILAIVGRPNVGKSTLFNRLVGSRTAIVEEMPGVTRDRIYGVSEWNGIEFSVIDTGGYVRGSDDIFEGEIRKQVDIAIEESEVILFVVDVTTGVTDLDISVADLLRRSKKPVFLVANKVDTPSRENDALEFYSLGLGDLHHISAINGSGTGDLLDEVVKKFSPEGAPDDDSGVPKIAVVGKPNVGKSSFINAITGEDRNIVTPISGTTRDAVDTRYKLFGFDFRLIDTAGIRKRAKVHEDIEYYSVMRSIRSIEYSDVCIFMVDATEGIQRQDLSIFYIIEKNHKGVVVVVNKWDLVEKSNNTMKDFEEKLLKQLAPFNDVPVIFTSTITKQRIHKVLEKAMEVFENRTKRIATHKLNDFVQEMMERNPPPAVKGKYVKIKFATQLPTHAPSFAFFCNLPQYVKDPYKRFVENRLREEFNFEGVPVRIFFRAK
ncbi:MAG: ribosome biogenesis GTPase Der [Crocinitomicaceae bacterium]|nr:ribosome biogenesis GTPase Der [Crocinitomicaceae bacterium]MBK8924365.1 ribosome biogenesis GTPase Der [Crocinitomicaceae bacterium]